MTVRCVRAFRGAGEPFTLAKRLDLRVIPAPGVRVLVDDDLALAVVDVTVRPLPSGANAGPLPPVADLYLEPEDGAAADAARERGWQPE